MAPLDTWQAGTHHPGVEAEARGNRPDANRCSGRGARRYGDLLHSGHMLECAEEAGRIAGGKQLLRVGGPAGAAEFLRGSDSHVEQAVGADGLAIAPAVEVATAV